jgi:hypothetical protein
MDLQNTPTRIEMIDTASLIPYANNAKLHSPEQVAQIAASIREFGFNNPVLIDKDNGIIAGHGRVFASKRLELKQVPCIRLSHLTDAQKKAFILADNRLGETGGGWDEELVRVELLQIQEAGLNIALTGFDEITNPDDLNEQDNVGEVPFTEYIGEQNNYIVLTFNNETDWLMAWEHFGVETKKDLYKVGKMDRMGLGRVINGGEYLKKITNNNG